MAIIIQEQNAKSDTFSKIFDLAKDRTHRLSGSRPRRALIVGAGDVGRTLARSLEAEGHYQVVGFVDDLLELPKEEDWPLLGSRAATAKMVEKFGIDEVFVAYAPTWQQQLMDDLTLHHPEVRLRIVPSAYEASMRLIGVESCNDIALVRLVLGTGKLKEWVKRTFDVFVSIFGLILTAPLLVAAAIFMKLLSPGPIIFAQERIGRHGKPFTLYKLRTMVHNAEEKTGPVLANGKEDPRLTPVGKWLRLFRVDEMPQLWNVLKGEMSLVGPRPERPYFVKKFEQMVPPYSKRHQVRPGITGLAQVCAGYHTDPRDKLRFDLIYVSHQSIWLDLSILLKTVIAVFNHRSHEAKSSKSKRARP